MSFDWEELLRRAKEMARLSYEPPTSVAPELVKEIDYGLHQEITQPLREGLFAEGPGECAVTFFHLGRLFPKPVRISALVDGIARDLIYDKALFKYPPGHPAERMPEGAGFAGFRIHDPRGEPKNLKADDWVAFLGASYFRSRGDLGEYGISARGIAINTANPEPPFTEEFPDFREFWVEPTRDARVTVYALLDGPSIVGAFRFEITREPKITMVVDCSLHLRKDVVRFGIAPLTSMFYYGKINRFIGGDWRPAVHDSEGLAIWNGQGEKLWRPLNNPPRVIVSSFADENPKGFGLLQRERDFEAFQDGGVSFERRPNLWVETIGNWGKGSVQLLELPTRAEFEDNIGAFWVPADPARAGSSYRFGYRLHWSGVEPFSSSLARCTATRMTNPWNTDDGGFTQGRHVVVDFKGDLLADLDPQECWVDVSSGPGGGFLERDLVKHPGGDLDRWRVFLTVGTGDAQLVEARLLLRHGKRPLSETLLTQFHPRV